MTAAETRRLRAALEARVLERAAAFRERHAPLTPDRMAAGIGFRWRVAAIAGRDGLLDAASSTILVAEGQSPRRQRFTLAHEVMHRLIEEDGELLSDLHEAYEGAALERALERLCNLGAAEMLLPRAEVARALAASGPNPRLLWELADRFGVSEPAAAVAVVGALGPGSLAAVFGGCPPPLSFPAPPPTRGTVLPEDHPLAAVLTTGLPQRGTLELPGGARAERAWARPWRGRVYLLATGVEAAGG
ncbi:ImmA/IrrE family metallo-endopeptidase [Oceanithermus desulfurans]